MPENAPISGNAPRVSALDGSTPEDHRGHGCSFDPEKVAERYASKWPADMVRQFLRSSLQ
jgi:hypothetical protein